MSAPGEVRMRVRDLRVEVLPAPEEDELPGPRTVKVEVRKLQGEKGRLLKKPDREITLLHRPSMHAVRAWGRGRRDELVESLLPLLAARVVAGEGGTAVDGVIRRYEFGASPLVRDRRSGRQTGNLERVFEGELDLVL